MLRTPFPPLSSLAILFLTTHPIRLHRSTHLFSPALRCAAIAPHFSFGLPPYDPPPLLPLVSSVTPRIPQRSLYGTLVLRGKAGDVSHFCHWPTSSPAPLSPSSRGGEPTGEHPPHPHRLPRSPWRKLRLTSPARFGPRCDVSVERRVGGTPPCWRGKGGGGGASVCLG